MQAVLKDKLVAASDDIVSAGGYEYFPPGSVQRDWLEKSPKTANDLLCPHGVQFYHATVDGRRHERAAWSYESPQPKMQQAGGRFGFWTDVKVA